YTYKTGGGVQFTRLAMEIANMLTDDGTVSGTANSASDMTTNMLDGWDFVITDDSEGYGRPDPVTGELPMPGLAAANAYYQASSTNGSQQLIISPTTGNNTPVPNSAPTPTNIFPLARPITAMQNALGNYDTIGFTSDTVTETAVFTNIDTKISG